MPIVPVAAQGRPSRLVATLARVVTMGALIAVPAPRVGVAQAPVASPSAFTPHTIDTGLTGGYQVVIADLNRDARPDVIALASGLKELRWYENPSWTKHVLVTGLNRPINAAAHDLDGDGVPEIALAHEFSAVYATGLGVVSILTHQGDPTQPWSIKEIDRLPTSHRVRFADVEGNGKKVLVNFPLIGSQALAPAYRDRVPLVMYRPGNWAREVITDADEGVVIDEILAALLESQNVQCPVDRWNGPISSAGSCRPRLGNSRAHPASGLIEIRRKRAGD